MGRVRLAAAAVLVAVVCRRASAPERAGGVVRAASAEAGDAPWTIVYDQVVEGNQDLYSVSAAGGLPRRLTDDPGHDMLPRFTHDGRRLLFASDRTGHWQIWEMPASGGPARRVRENAFTEYQVDE